MRKSDLVLDKYWVKHSCYFILTATVVLGIGITDWELLLCHGISEGNVDKKMSTIKYNNRTAYDCFNNTFKDGYDIPDFNLVKSVCSARDSG